VKEALMLALTYIAFALLALAAPPQNVVAVVLFLVAAILAGIQKSWVLCLIAAGMAVLSWPW
jgi:hypothetical protein